MCSVEQRGSCHNYAKKPQVLLSFAGEKPLLLPLEAVRVGVAAAALAARVAERAEVALCRVRLGEREVAVLAPRRVDALVRERIEVEPGLAPDAAARAVRASEALCAAVLAETGGRIRVLAERTAHLAVP